MPPFYFLTFAKVSVSVSKTFGLKKSLGIGLENIWSRKKSRYRSRYNFLVSSLSAARSVLQFLSLKQMSFLWSKIRFRTHKEGAPPIPQKTETYGPYSKLFGSILRPLTSIFYPIEYSSTKFFWGQICRLSANASPTPNKGKQLLLSTLF